MVREKEAELVALVRKILGKVKKVIPAAQHKLLSSFAKQYYLHVTLEDLEAHTLEDLSDSLRSNWEFFYQRAPGETKLRIGTPSSAHRHTIIEMVREDIPFIVDTLQMEVDRNGLRHHFLINLADLQVSRNAKGEVVKLYPSSETHHSNTLTEALISMEIDRISDPKALEALKENLRNVLGDVQLAVTDWNSMRSEVMNALSDIECLSNSNLDPAEIQETKAFLEWLMEHFIFLGYRRYTVQGSGDKAALRIVPETGLGVLRDESKSKVSRYYADLPKEARKLALSKHLLIIAKTNTHSTVHRRAYTDYIGVKIFSPEGDIVGERRFVGLFTSVAYDSDPSEIPVFRHKVSAVLKQSGFSKNGYDAKRLLHILRRLPRDELFQSSVDELSQLAMGILQLEERRKVRLFVRQDAYARFISCVVCVPKENFSTDLSYRMQRVLLEAFKGKDVAMTPYFSESVVVLIHYIIRVDPKKNAELVYDIKSIEQQLFQIARLWARDFKDALVNHFGDVQASQYFSVYQEAFPLSYREAFTPDQAVLDMIRVESLSEEHPLELDLYQQDNTKCFKLFQFGNSLPLSEIMPMLEHMGLIVVNEHPYTIKLQEGKCCYITNFAVDFPNTVDLVSIKDDFQEVFKKVWFKRIKSDPFNALVLFAGLHWQEVRLLRAYSRYLRQIAFIFSQEYIEEILIKQVEVTRLLVSFFYARFDPALFNPETEQNHRVKRCAYIERAINKKLEEVKSLDEDRILRQIYFTIKATLRTNFFQNPGSEEGPPYVVLKFNAAAIPDIPLPIPMVECFIYSARFEGIHLRGGKVARGGIRWSDRREDYRTEVLGLMKAQQVKNALIVPTGSKGGFVPKHLPVDGNRQAIMEEAKDVYRCFIRGLLDITDNIQQGTIIPPKRTICYDEPDPYLVVAADKGTATFSDYANEIAFEYDYWLDDAFASGSATGYDHKKMGITARGAWEAVKHHFIERNLDINKNFTVVGIGDMSGDVFGNGMLLSKNIQLIAAFNHMHIFLDPNPDPMTSFKERKRLFRLARSTWADYNPKFISKGGGVFSRSEKSIRLSVPMRKILGITRDSLTPDELIKAILKAPVDLLWNGGIGTYIKSQEETHQSVGDRANDTVRVNGVELRCKIVAEGGNLGCTQRGRIEYALNGGRINTDFIDNVSGVDCSDHEVNIKILLHGITAAGKMTQSERNALLVAMTDDVAKLVLHNNYQQNLIITLSMYQLPQNLSLYQRFMDDFVRLGYLDRDLEYLPNSKILTERLAQGVGLVRPELAVLLSYSKIVLKKQLLASDVVETPYFLRYALHGFPMVLRKRFEKEILQHSLLREIVATQVSNYVVQKMGIVFIHQMQKETGCSMATVVKAHAVAKEVFRMDAMLEDLEKAEKKMQKDAVRDAGIEIVRLIRRATRWFLYHYGDTLEVEKTITYFSKHVDMLFQSLPNMLVGSQLATFKERKRIFLKRALPATVVTRISSIYAMYSLLNVTEVSLKESIDICKIAPLYFTFSEKLSLVWLRNELNTIRVDDIWSILTRAAFKKDVDSYQRTLMHSLLGQKMPKSASPDQYVSHWLATHEKPVAEWLARLAELRASTAIDFTMFSVAVRALAELNSSVHAVTSELDLSSIKKD